LESELTEARRQLEEAKSQAQQAEDRLTLQLENLQKERDSLVCELEHARNEVNKTNVRQDAAGAHVERLESELTRARCELDQAHKFEKNVKGLSSDMEVMQPGAEIDSDERARENITPAIDDKEVTLSTETAVTEPNKGRDVIVEEYWSEPSVSEPDITISENVNAIKIPQVESLELQKEPQTEQTDQEIEPPTETAAVQSDEQEQLETEARESGPVAVETSSSVPADVTVEDVNAADFESATEKIIFINALYGISSLDKATRVDAIKVMAGIGHELSARAIIGQMAKEPAAQIRAECIKALAEVNIKEGLPAIENALSEQDVSVRLAAVRGLYRLGGPASAPELVSMLCDENEDIRRRTASCIGWLGRGELAVELVPLLDDSGASVRLAVVEAMGNLRSRQVVSDLIEHLNDTERKIGKAIISALQKITGKKMSGSFPRNEKEIQILIIRWCQWWKDEQKVLCQI